MKNEVKTIKFEDGELLGVRDEQGQVWLGIRKACRDIGLTEGQATRQRENIKTDLVLSKGCANLTILTTRGQQELWAIKEEFVTLWLAKISLTPSMQSENPEVVKKLVSYQLKAKDVLAAAFLPQYQKSEPLITKTEIREMIKDEIKQIFISELQQFKSEIINQLQRVLPSSYYTDWKTEVNSKIKRPTEVSLLNVI